MSVFSVGEIPDHIWKQCSKEIPCGDRKLRALQLWACDSDCRLLIPDTAERVPTSTVVSLSFNQNELVVEVGAIIPIS